MTTRLAARWRRRTVRTIRNQLLTRPLDLHVAADEIMDDLDAGMQSFARSKA